jgi:hypothetical protein
MTVTGSADQPRAGASVDLEERVRELEVDNRRLELRLRGLRRQLDERLALIRQLREDVGGPDGVTVAEWRRRALAAENEVGAINARLTMRVTRRPRQLYGWLRAQRAAHGRGGRS